MTAAKKKTPTKISAIRNSAGDLVIDGKPQAKAKVSHAKPIAPPKVIAEIHLIPLDRITIQPQVRTIFTEESIAELAADIEARGLRQPIEVTPVGDERYLLTLGERRLRAITHLGHKAIPATIVKTDDANRLVDQLAENIQREDLSVQDLATAVRALYDQLGKIDLVIEKVKKSKAWVSKHLAITCSDFHWKARELLQSGKVNDLEILGTLSQILRLDYNAGMEAVEKIEAGELTREMARAMLKKLKEAVKKCGDNLTEEEKAQQQADRDEAIARAEEQCEYDRKQREEGSGPEFLQWAMRTLEHVIMSPAEDDDVTDLLNSYSQAQRDALEGYLVEYQDKVRAEPSPLAAWAVRINWDHPKSDPENYILQLAGIAALTGTGQEINNLYAFFEVIAAANRAALGETAE